jgi:hypothetical protein
MLDPNKYLVLKRKDLSLNALGELERIEVEDAVVIRRQDIFAEAGLHAYAANVLTGIEILSLLPQIAGMVDIEHLQDIADYFHEQAVSCKRDTFFRKLPD